LRQTIAKRLPFERKPRGRESTVDSRLLLAIGEETVGKEINQGLDNQVVEEVWVPGRKRQAGREGRRVSFIQATS